jgi:Tol biopolymer transport system component
MAKENLVKKLRNGIGRKVMPYVLSAFLLGGLSAHYGCDPNSPNPDNPDNPASKPPIAMFTAKPMEGVVPLEVDFDGSFSYACEPGAKIEKYYWDFDGDGDTDLTTSGVSGAWVKYIYENPGKYTPSLVVEDSQEQRSNKTTLEETIIVNEDIVTLGEIAFLSNRDEGTGEIYIGDLQLDSEGNYIGLNNVQRLTNNENNDIKPSYSPDGSKIVWSANRPTPDGWFALYVVDPNETDGDDETRITPFIDGFSALSPIWCIDEKIYFNFWDHNLNTQGIARVDPENGNIEKIIEEEFHGWLSGRPACSPDGSKIAFVTDRDGNAEIYIANSDGTGEWNLTNHPADDYLPVWYEDELFFISKRGGSPDIWAINSSGGGLRRILENYGTETDLGVSSDGSKIIFAYDIDMSNPQLYFINTDGTGWTQLTFGGIEGANCYPTWKPKIEDLNFN